MTRTVGDGKQGFNPMDCLHEVQGTSCSPLTRCKGSCPYSPSVHPFPFYPSKNKSYSPLARRYPTSLDRSSQILHQRHATPKDTLLQQEPLTNIILPLPIQTNNFLNAPRKDVIAQPVFLWTYTPLPATTAKQEKKNKELTTCQL
ncbi:hypothetical protein B0T21DRAFT_359337 [Apiosordaria backusii]|uniref:Uncharacterized protein n=1 Tax=Apiosordaria backusii TaxID=314023 RepID=A0AA40ETM5_9PEZI|nr:hypothetical protein B0T21DRAFT_359337 [Apiosordaria backusii]